MKIKELISDIKWELTKLTHRKHRPNGRFLADGRLTRAEQNFATHASCLPRALHSLAGRGVIGMEAMHARMAQIRGLQRVPKLPGEGFTAELDGKQIRIDYPAHRDPRWEQRHIKASFRHYQAQGFFPKGASLEGKEFLSFDAATEYMRSLGRDALVSVLAGRPGQQPLAHAFHGSIDRRSGRLVSKSDGSPDIQLGQREIIKVTVYDIKKK